MGQAEIGRGISIHAPVKGATIVKTHRGVRPWISIHAPVKGATGRVSEHITAAEHFNPRSREGSDRDTLTTLREIEISIHAPVKGATRLVIVTFGTL